METPEDLAKKYLEYWFEDIELNDDFGSKEMRVERLASLLKKHSIDTLQRCWDEINKKIKIGSLPGNGTDESAERNGLIITTN